MVFRVAVQCIKMTDHLSYLLPVLKGIKKPLFPKSFPQEHTLVPFKVTFL